EVSIPVTIVEVPPLRAVGARIYRRGPNGQQVTAEAWKGTDHPALLRRMPHHAESSPEELDRFRSAPGDEVRLILHTQPEHVYAVGEKVGRLFEVRVAGEKIEERKAFALERLGTELSVDQLAKEGEFVDVLGVTKGFGFQGHIQRWGVKLQPRKNSKHRRMIGTL
ncbi:50S ribosomal protein L3P, partial [mine drainage metagenome]